MAITQKFAYAAQLAHYKEAITSDADKFKDSIVFTGDGYIISRGNVIKGTVLTNKEVSGDYGLKFDSSTNTVAFYDENGTKIGESVNIPDIYGVSDDDVEVTDSTNNGVEIKHKTYAANSSANTTKATTDLTVLTSVTISNGHVSNYTTQAVTLDKVKFDNSLTADTNYNVLVSSSASGTDHLKSTSVKIKSTGDISTPGAISAASGSITGTFNAATLQEGGNNLSSIYVKQTTKATATQAGIVKLSDSTSASGAEYKAGATDLTYAATPYAVYSAVTEAKDYANKEIKTALNTALGDSAGAFKFVGNVSSDTEFNEITSADKGSVYIATGSFDIAASKIAANVKESVEPGDMIIFNGEKWVVVQRNIDKAVTYSADLSDGQVVLGSSTSSIKALANASKSDNKVLRCVEGSVQWGDDTPNRSVKIIPSGTTATTEILAAASLTTLQFKSGDNIYITKDDATAGLINIAAHKYSASDGITEDPGSNTTTFKLADSGVTADTYGMDKASNTLELTLPKITVDKYGRITSAENNTVTIKDTTYSNGDGLSLSATNVFSLNQAETGKFGGIKIQSAAPTSGTTSVNNPTASGGGNYEVKLTEKGVAYVNVPWKNDHTTYTLSGALSSSSVSKTESNQTYSGYTFTTSLAASGTSTTGSSASFSILGGNNVTITYDSTNKYFLIDSPNTWRAVNAYKCGADNSSQVLGSTGADPLTFSQSFCWDEKNKVLDICWAEISENGTVTYK